MNWHVLKVCRCRRRRRINFATMIILVTVCQRVRNGEMFYRVIIVTAHEDGILGARERSGRKTEKPALRACSWRNFLFAKILWIVKEDGNVGGVHLSPLPLPTTLPLLREERTSDPEIPTRRCGYWTYFSAANWDEPRRGWRMKNFSCRDHVTILCMIYGDYLSLSL